MGPLAIPVASQSFLDSSWIFLFAIPPFLVGVFFGAYRPRTRRSLMRLALAEAVTAAFVGACLALRYFELAATEGLVGPFLLLATLGWPAAFLGAAGRMRHDSTRRASVG